MGYAIGLEKLSANEHFVGAQMVYVLYPTNLIISGISFITATWAAEQRSKATEIKTAPLVVSPILAEFGGRCQKRCMLGVWFLQGRGLTYHQFLKPVTIL